MGQSQMFQPWSTYGSRLTPHSDRLVYIRWAPNLFGLNFRLKTMTADTDRRSGTRIATRVPTRVRTAQGADHSAETRDVSANGIFLYTKSRMEKGAEVELVLILPPELTSGEKCWVCCHATIVRVEEQGSEFGVAAQISRMDILPELTV